MLLAVGLLVLAAADAGAPPAPDAGRPGSSPQASAPAAGAAPVAARPLLLIAESDEPLAKVATARSAERARLPGLTTTLKIGKTYSLGFFADGYTLPASRVVDLAVDVLITDSTGRQVFELANTSRAKTMDPKTMLAVPLSPTLRVPFGLTDPEGTWSVRMILFDGVRGTTTRAESTFTVKR